ncbi:MAG: methyltransferase domain-containing protein [Pseudomonadales bacterium]|nr:methyltransferase domain-containing protein [Pseudomonadales bacterium]
MDHIDIKTDVSDLHMIEGNSSDLIYSSHTLEYFDRQQVVDVLREWRRVLKPGGVLRLAVPDFDSLLAVYKVTGELDKILGPLYGRMQIKTPDGKAMLYHKTVYDFDSLSRLLNDSGFEDVKRYRWQETVHKDYDDHSQAYYPHMDKENGILISLNVEARKSFEDG